MSEPLRKRKKMAKAFRISVESGVSDFIDKLNDIPKADKEVFLWELVRNAARALFKFRLKTMYETYRDGDDGGKKDLFIEIIPDKVYHTLSIVDNGLGMTEDVLKRLFTVPEPALKKYMKVAHLLMENKVTAHQFYKPPVERYGDSSSSDDDEEDLCADDLSLGFFSAFMVADRVEIATKHCGVGALPWFISGDRSGFFCDVLPSSRAHAGFDDVSRRPWGTTVTLYLKEDHFRYLHVRKLKVLIDNYPLQLCRYPIYIRGVGTRGQNRKVRLRRADEEDEKEDIKSLKNQFKDLLKLYKKVLVGTSLSSGLERVVISDYYFDLPAFLTPDKKTFKINPRNRYFIRLMEFGSRKEVVDAIIFQYLACESSLKMHKRKNESFCRL